MTERPSPDSLSAGFWLKIGIEERLEGRKKGEARIFFSFFGVVFPAMATYVWLKHQWNRSAILSAAAW